MEESGKSWIHSKAEMMTYLINGWFRKQYRKELRKRLQKDEVTIISNNCCAGIIYYDLGLRFDSPTINLTMGPEEYLCFLENLDEAIRSEVTEDRENRLSYPVGILTLKNGKTIRLYFKHYASFDEAKEKWNERRLRIHRDNIYVLFEMGRNTDRELLERFFALPYEHLFALVDRDVREYSQRTQRMKFYQLYDSSSNATIMNHRKGIFAYKRYLNDFDYVAWLNQ